MESDFLTQFRTVDRKKIILSFFETISWAEECNITEYSSNFVILKHDKTWFFPCLFSTVDHFRQEMGMFLCFTEEKQEQIEQEAVIIDGDLNNIEMDYVCNLLCRCNVTPFFITATSKINQSRWIFNQMDGVDWGRSLAAIAEKGTDAKPIMEWE